MAAHGGQGRQGTGSLSKQAMGVARSSSTGNALGANGTGHVNIDNNSVSMHQLLKLKKLKDSQGQLGVPSGTGSHSKQSYGQ